MNTKQLDFAYKVRHVLNENIEHMPQATTEKLAMARKIALSRKKKESPLRVLLPQSNYAGNTAGGVRGSSSWLGRMGLALPLVALIAGLAGIYQFEEQQRINETAEIDASVLADELPLSAYLDQGFRAYLAKRGD
jgi:hypothetical protein